MPFLLQQQNERSLFGKSFVFETYKYELMTMKVVIENVRKFLCVMKTKFFCLGNFYFPSQTTSRSHSIYPEYTCCSRISEEALIAL